MDNLLKKNIGEIVVDDYRTAQIFKNHNIDFCCKGNRNIVEVAKENNLSASILLQKVEEVQNSKKIDSTDFKSWPLDLLTDYIEKKHHRYVEKTIPVLNEYLEKLCIRHGVAHPELFEIKEEFKLAGAELAMHMKKEELMVFPAIRKMVRAKKDASPLMKFKFDTIQSPIQVMMEDHIDEGERFQKIRTLSNDYTPPVNACDTFHVAFSLLKEFEADLHEHIHLENNMLFPKSEQLEKELTDVK